MPPWSFRRGYYTPLPPEEGEQNRRRHSRIGRLLGIGRDAHNNASERPVPQNQTVNEIERQQWVILFEEDQRMIEDEHCVTPFSQSRFVRVNFREVLESDPMRKDWESNFRALDQELRHLEIERLDDERGILPTRQDLERRQRLYREVLELLNALSIYNEEGYPSSLLQAFREQLPRNIGESTRETVAQMPHKMFEELDAQQRDSDCPICWEPHQGDEVLAQLPCGHAYHDQCIISWLQEQSYCPKCRAFVKRTYGPWLWKPEEEEVGGNP